MLSVTTADVRKIILRVNTLNKTAGADNAPDNVRQHVQIS